MLKSLLADQWVEGTGSGTPIVDATSGAVVDWASTDGLDLGAAVAHARRLGGSTLRAMSFADRGKILEALSKATFAARDNLIEVSRQGGTTRGDGKFDIDGAAGTLAAYAALGRQLGDGKLLLDGAADNVLRSARFAAQHVWTPRLGVAVHINAFNFPAWGLAEKLAVAVLAGVPVLTKPATATAPLAVALVALWHQSGLLPPGVLSLVSGGVRDLLDHLGAQDHIAFTGSSETAALLRSHPAVVSRGTRLNVEADSLNVAVMGPDVEVGSDTFLMFVADVVRDMTQKSGQKCTAIRRVLVPAHKVEDVREALVDRLSQTVVGDPNVKGTTLGPLSSPSQYESVRAGAAALAAVGTTWWLGSAPEGGCFVAPALFCVLGGVDAPIVHDHEVFGPVATVLPWSGDAAGAVEIVARGGGGLVASVYSDDVVWAREVVLGLAPWHGRIHWGSHKVADQSPGPGTVLPTLVHGGPGRAGGGEELGGERGLRFYWQRTAVQGDRALMERMFGG